MDRLWSPWRMEYLEADRDEDRGCVFCNLDEEDAGRVLRRTELAFVTLAKYPYNPGHLIVLPARHVDDLEAVTPEEAGAIHELMQRSLAALRAEWDPHGFNLGLNLGRAAGAGIPEHLHWHVVPRWNGDTNFMPVVGQTRVLPELLADTHRRLAPRFADA
jgi:ATP adenylyltransferase